jgi:nucleotide-binding universal stress UspA family protein
MTGATPADDAVRFANILCPVDLSDFSTPVLAHAVALARWYHARVTALHVFAAWLPPASLATYPGWMTHVPEAREAIARELRAVVDPFAAEGVTLTTAEGDAAAEIVRHAAETRADLIVMGTHGRSGFDRVTLGSVTEKVLRRASCPVLTLPPGSASAADAVEYRQILCPTDFSDCSHAAIDRALSLARRTGARITLLHVVETADGDETIDDLHRRQSDAARRAVHDAVLSRAQPADRVDEAVAIGKPYREILRAAEERHADVIVMGVRGRGPVDLTLFGSTTNQVVRRAACPVITLRA